MRVERATPEQFAGAIRRHPKRLRLRMGVNGLLDGADRIRMRKLREQGWTGLQLAAEFDVSVRTIWRNLGIPTDDLINPVEHAVIVWAQRNELWLSQNEVASLSESVAAAVGRRLRNRIAKRYGERRTPRARRLAS